MKSEEKLLREMGISSWSLKKNFSFDGKNILKKEIKEFSKTTGQQITNISGRRPPVKPPAGEAGPGATWQFIFSEGPPNLGRNA